MTCLLFCEHLDTLLADGNFSLYLYAFEILKNFQFFSESCLWELSFHNLASSNSSKFTYVVLVSTSCFDEVVLAEIVYSGSQFITKFDQIFYHILTDLILLSLIFFLVLFQDNHKLAKARFVWRVFGWLLNGFSLRVVSRVLPAMLINFIGVIF